MIVSRCAADFLGAVRSSRISLTMVVAANAILKARRLRRQLPECLDQFEPISCPTDDRRKLVGLDLASRQVARAVVDGWKQPADRLVARRDVM